MRLPWLAVFDHGGRDSGVVVLWTPDGFYTCIDGGLGQLCIDFYPRPSDRKPSRRLGTFLGPNHIDEAEKTVERHIAMLSGHRLIEGKAEQLKAAAE